MRRQNRSTEIIASRKFHKPLEKFLSSAESFANGMEEPDHKERLLRNQRTRQVLSSVFAEHKLDALVYPLQKRLTVPLTEFNQVDRNGILASVTGFPAVTVPAGFSPPTATAPLGVPVGMDILGKPWSEGRLIELAYGFEQAGPGSKAAEQCACAAQAIIAPARAGPQTLGYISFQRCPRS